MLITVIIPVYNTSSYLQRCVDSIFGQNLKDVELIFIDDCSTDDSFEVLNRCLANHDLTNVKVLRNDHNLGSGETRNRGIREASGEYVIFIDSDDYVTADYFHTLRHQAIGKPDIVVFNYTEIWGERKVVKHVDLPKSSQECVEHLLMNKLHNSLCNKMFKKSLFIDFNIKITEGLSMFEDKSICFKLFHHATTISYVDVSLYFYDRSRENSLTKRFQDSTLKASVIVCGVIDAFFSDKSVPLSTQRAIQANKAHVLGFIGLYGEKPNRREYAKAVGKLPFMAFFRACNMPLHYRVAAALLYYRLGLLLSVIRRLYFLCK